MPINLDLDLVLLLLFRASQRGELSYRSQVAGMCPIRCVVLRVLQRRCESRAIVYAMESRLVEVVGECAGRNDRGAQETKAMPAAKRGPKLMSVTPKS